MFFEFISLFIKTLHFSHTHEVIFIRYRINFLERKINKSLKQNTCVLVLIFFMNVCPFKIKMLSQKLTKYVTLFGESFIIIL